MKFADAAAKAGLTAANVSGDTTNKKYILEMNGSGVAFIDYNRDGYVDLFVVNGTRLDRGVGDAGSGQPSLPQQWRRDFHGRDERGRS